MSVNEFAGNEKAREKIIVQTGIIGIIVNLLLAGFKAVILLTP